MINFYKGFISKDDLCFDIGANIGERTSVFLKLGAKVISVEPQRQCFEILKNKFGKKKNVIIVRCALGSSEEEKDLLICDETNECSTLSEQFVQYYSVHQRLHWSKVEKVQVVTLEKLFELHGIPQFIKMDVEGYESEVFEGLKRIVPCIAFEFNRPLIADTIRCIETLVSLGDYRFNFIEYENMNLVSDHWFDGSKFLNNIHSVIPPETLTGEIFARIRG